jgi:putative DNA primase/helicase
MTKVLQIALAYHPAGLGVIPVRPDGSKAPALPRGHPYLYQRPTEADVHRWFSTSRNGIAIACGAVSGQLETLDFETLLIYRRWRERIEAQIAGLADRLCWVLTPGHLESRGMHGRYRCLDVSILGSMILASEPCEVEKHQCRDVPSRSRTRRVLIETRGQGSYAIAPGSPATCHDTGHLWEHVAGPDLLHLPNLTVQEREVLLASARALNSVHEPQAIATGTHPFIRSGRLRVGDDFNACGPDWPAILEPHGWQLLRTSGVVRFWRRPGKQRGSWSATTGYCRSSDGCDLLHVFSANAFPFQPRGSYSKFRAYVLLNHQGDYRAAVRELPRLGFGKPPSHSRIAPSSALSMANSGP